MGEGKQQVPEELRFVPLWEFIGCHNCNKKSCSYAKCQDYASRSPKTLWDCQKRTSLIDFLITYISAIPIIVIYRWIFYLTDRVALAIFISEVVMFILDLVFCHIDIEEYIKKYYYGKESQREKEYKERREEFIKIQEQKEVQEIDFVKEIYRQLVKLKNVEPFIKIEEYSKMLELLNEVCKNLRNIDFIDCKYIRFFYVQLPEFQEVCKKINNNSNILSQAYFEEFKLSLKLLITRLENIIKVMIWDTKKDELIVLQCLNRGLDNDIKAEVGNVFSER